MTPAEQAIVTALTVEGKAAVKALLLDIIDNEVPALIAAEVSKLPVAYGPLLGTVVTGFYPQVKGIVDAKIAALLA